MSTGMDAAMAGGFASKNVNLATLIADRWWTLLVRGLVAIVFGILALVAPRTSLLAIVFVWGAYALIDGFVHLLSAWRSSRGRGWMIFHGLVSIGAGVVAFAYTGLTAFVLLMLIAAWAVVTGIAEIVAAFELRKQIEGEWLLAASGVLSIIFGVVLFVSPGVGVIALLWVIGVYAIIFGLLLIALSFRVRSWKHGPRAVPPAGAEPLAT